VETDLMLSALAPQTRDLVAREPLEHRGATYADRDRGPNATVAGRSAKTRVAGVPLLEAAVVPSPLGPAGPSQGKRFTAFMASVGLSFVVGLPLVLRIDGVWGGGRAARPDVPIASTPIAVTATAPMPTTPATPVTQATAVVNAVVAQPLASTNPAVPPAKGTRKPVLSAKTPSVPTPVTAPPAPQAPAALNTASPPPPPATQAPPAPTLQHGSLIQ
jgi:hypothetical protein